MFNESQEPGNSGNGSNSDKISDGSRWGHCRERHLGKHS